METTNGRKLKLKAKSGHSKDSVPISVPLWELFSYADTTDICLVALGTLGAIGDGMAQPGVLIILSDLIDVLGPQGSNTIDPIANSHNLNKVRIYLHFGHVSCVMENPPVTKTNYLVLGICAVLHLYRLLVHSDVVCCFSRYVWRYIYPIREKQYFQ